MTKTAKWLVGIMVLGAFLLGFSAYHEAPQVLGIGALNRDQFNTVSVATTTSVGTGGAIVISSSTFAPGAAHYMAITNSGSSSVSCFPIDFSNGTESSSGLTYGGGWWLVSLGGAISLDGTAIYGGTVWCVTGSGTTTVGIVAK